LRQITVAIFAVLAIAGAKAADPAQPAPDDADALTLADKAPGQNKAPGRAWRAYAEGSISRTSIRGLTSPDTAGRASLDGVYDDTVAAGLRAVVSDRLDLIRANGSPRETNVNTLREAYLSWHARTDALVDVGRVNLRYGSALGYNPTDYFKAGALRSITSPDPASLRENRQGTVVIQGQKVWSDASFTAAYSPRLATTTSDSTFSLDFGATNPRDRWLLAGSYRFGPGFNPQALLFGGAGTPTQAGLNISGLLNSATVGFLELSAGRGRSLISQASGSAEDEAMQRRSALGLTYTTAFNLSLTAEYEYNSAAPDRRQWDTFAAGAPIKALRLLGLAQTEQDLPVRRAVFVYAMWRDAMMKNLDLSAFVRRDFETSSRDQWIETRFHWSTAEVAFQWHVFSGDPGSVFGSVPESHRLEVQLRKFF
jgi:hypothetical protein